MVFADDFRTYRHGSDSQSIHDPTITSPHPHPHPHQNQQSHPHRSQMRHHRRRHPPPPSVEDEVESLSKEYPPQSILRESDARSRGTVNQEPILIELENHDRRFVLLSDSDSRRQGRGVPEKQKKNNDGPSLTVDTEQLSFLNRRTPSPYSYSKSGSSRVPSSGDYFLSPDGIASPNTTKVPRSPSTEKGSRSNKEDVKERSSVASSESITSYRSDHSEDSDLDAREARRRRSKKGSRSARPSFAEEEAAHRRHLSFNNVPRPSLRAELSRVSIEASLAARTGSDFMSDDRSGSRTPTAPPRSHPSISQPGTSRRDTRSDPSRNPTSGPQPSPPGSPGKGYGSLPSSPHGPSSPRNGSSPSSPIIQMPYGPFDFESPRGRYERSASYGLPSQQNTGKPPFRLNSSMRYNSADSIPMSPPRIDIRSPSPERSGKSFLPYPDEDGGIAMPSATKYTSRTESFSSSLEPATSHPRQSSVSSNGSVSPSSKTSPSRPDLSSKMSLQEGSGGSRTPFSSEDGSETRRNEKQQPKPSIPTNLPLCPRSDYMRGFDDWHCLEIYPDFDICPTCYYEILRPTPYRKFLTMSPPRPLSAPIRCDFGRPWARLAWLITLKRERQDLSLIYAIVKISSTESRCPGDNEAVGVWYGLQDQTGAFVPDFAICPRDKRYIEALFPSLSSTFTRLVISGTTPREPFVCSLRSQSRRFPTYLDLLEDMDDAAMGPSSKQSQSSPSSYNRSRSPNTNSGAVYADPRPLIDLAKSLSSSTRKTSTAAPKADSVTPRRECTRNRIQPANSLWHFIPQFPILTVCEPCFDAVIWPAAKQGSSIANQFNQTLQPVPQPYNASAGSPFSSSSSFASTTASALSQAPSHTCQLYSPRMRRVFERAIQRGDLQLLVEKVRERKEMEVELRQQRADLLRLLGSLNGAGAGAGAAGYGGGSDSGGLDRERLRRELGRVENAWEDWE